MQAEATWGRLVSSRGGATTPSLWLVGGVVLVAASLVVVGSIVVLSSLLPSGGAGSGANEPPPTPSRPTPGVFTVGRQDQPGDGQGTGPTPTAAPGTNSSPALVPPPNTGGSFPIFVPSGSGSPMPPPSDAGTTGAPINAPGSSPQTAASPDVSAPAGPSPATGASPAVAAASSDPRVEKVLASLTSDEDKVGQLLLLGWIGSTAEAARPELEELRAGGIVYVQNASTAAEAGAINPALLRMAANAGLVPPLIAIDHEGGQVQRIKDVPNLGSNWDFAHPAPTDAEACQRGLRHAQTLSSLGFTMNLAPVLDVNNNPANPVIGTRSYSDDPEVVARLGAAYIRGLQGGGMVAVGKHFPGHGNTGVDSHLQLPILTQSVDELEKTELIPFRRAIEADVAAIMSAHIVFPAVDPSGVPGTLSRPVMTGLLRERLGFQGLAISDDMGAMKAITDNFGPGDAAVRAVNAGVDMIIMSAELARQRQARDALLQAVQTGDISRDRLDEAVRHVLQAKARAGLLGEAATASGVACP